MTESDINRKLGKLRKVLLCVAGVDAVISTLIYLKSPLFSLVLWATVLVFVYAWHTVSGWKRLMDTNRANEPQKEAIGNVLGQLTWLQ